MNDSDCNGLLNNLVNRPTKVVNEKDSDNCLVEYFSLADKSSKTNVEGVYAAGDMTDTPLRQIVTAAAEGAVAAHSAHEFLQKK